MQKSRKKSGHNLRFYTRKEIELLLYNLLKNYPEGLCFSEILTISGKQASKHVIRQILEDLEKKNMVEKNTIDIYFAVEDKNGK